MRLIDADKLLNNFRLLLNRSSLGEISPHESVSVGEIAGLIKDEPTAFDLESVIERIENIKTDNSCRDCKYKEKCDELQEFYNPADDVDLCALTTKHLALEILKSAANATNGKNGG